MATRNLLFVGGASPKSSSRHIVTEALTQARARGIRTHLINKADMLARTAEVNALADTVSAVDPENVVEWAQDQRFDIVMGLRDTVLPAVAETSALLGVVNNTVDVVRRVRNKDACRKFLAAKGFRQPAVKLCTGAGDAEAFLKQSKGPWVIKPRDAEASIGVRKVTGTADLPSAMDDLPDRNLFLVEEFVDGPEFSVEGVILSSGPKVLAVTAKEKLPPPYFVELGHVLSADLPDTSRQDIDRTVTAALNALGIRFGVFHVELWLDDEGVVLGEVHARPGGDWLHLLLTHAIPGLELFGLIYDDLLGIPSTQELTPTKAAASLFLAPPPGRLVRVNGWGDVTSHPDVLFAELEVQPGNEIAPVRQSGDRAGVIVAGADTAARARELARKLSDSVEFVVE